MRLFLHVGHGKTGSSFLQSWLALNADGMWRTNRLLYPEKCPLRGVVDHRARQGLFSMGNGFVLEEGLKRCETPAQRLRWLKKLLLSNINESELVSGLVFSSEPWVRRLPDKLDGLLAIADAWGIESIELWLLVRDPLEHACSVYGQMVKRHGFTGSLNDWLEIYDFPRILLQFLEVVQRCDDRLVLRIDHYGRRRKEILTLMQTWLGLDPSVVWHQPTSFSVNRSLTSDELLLMRWLNQRFGDSAASIGEKLVNDIPQLPAARLAPGLEVQTDFIKRWSKMIDDINHHLEVSEKLHLTPQDFTLGHNSIECNNCSSINLSKAQLSCLLDEVMEINPIRKSVDRTRLLMTLDRLRNSLGRSFNK